MTRKVSVDLESPSPYIEKDTAFHRFKRDLSYAFPLRKIVKKFGRESPISVLEVGTGSGYFFPAARRRLPRATFWGVEYDPRLLEETKKRAPFAECFQGNAESFSLLPETFHVVVSFQVIEHLYDPSAMIARARAHIKPGGILIITTPNLDGLGAKLMRAQWHGYRDDHVSLKGGAAWIKLIESHGFNTLYDGSTFFSGIPLLNRVPFGFLNWGLLASLGAMPWRWGEAFVGVFELKNDEKERITA